MPEGISLEVSLTLLYQTIWNNQQPSEIRRILHDYVLKLVASKAVSETAGRHALKKFGIEYHNQYMVLD
jgi:hypothetical protein